MTITALSITGIKNVQEGDSIAGLILRNLDNSEITIRNRDIVVIASKVVSKAEGRIASADAIEVSREASVIAERNGFDPRQVQLALNEAVRVIETKRVLITQNALGLICNFSGVDKSNTPENSYTLLPTNPDESAERIRNELENATGRNLGVIISDTQGRPWRKGSLNLAIGCSGISAFKHNMGRKDLYGRVLERSTVCQVDELAALAEPLMGQAGGRVPVVIIRGYEFEDDGSRCRDINRSEQEDILRKKSKAGSLRKETL